jgi:hypothetical protein
MTVGQLSNFRLKPLIKQKFENGTKGRFLRPLVLFKAKLLKITSSTLHFFGFARLAQLSIMTKIKTSHQ